MSDNPLHKESFNDEHDHSERVSLSQRVQLEGNTAQITQRPIITEGVTPAVDAPPKPPNPGHISGLEKQFPELNERANRLVQDMAQMSAGDAAKAFKQLANEPGMQKYDALQAMKALSQAQKEFDPDKRFTFSGTSTGELTMTDSALRPNNKDVAGVQMYSESEERSLKKSGAEPDEDATAAISKRFAGNDLSKLSDSQISGLLDSAAADMKSAHARSRFAASELSSALRDSGQDFVVDSDDGRLTVRGNKRTPVNVVTLSTF